MYELRISEEPEATLQSLEESCVPQLPCHPIPAPSVSSPSFLAPLFALPCPAYRDTFPPPASTPLPCHPPRFPFPSFLPSFLPSLISLLFPPCRPPTLPSPLLRPSLPRSSSFLPDLRSRLSLLVLSPFPRHSRTAKLSFSSIRTSRIHRVTASACSAPFPQPPPR